MQELTAMKTEWLPYGMVHYENKTWSIADFNAKLASTILDRSLGLAWNGRKQTFNADSTAYAKLGSMHEGLRKMLFLWQDYWSGYWSVR